VGIFGRGGGVVSSSARRGGIDAGAPFEVAEVMLVCLELKVVVMGVGSVIVLVLCALYRRIRAVEASGGDWEEEGGQWSLWSVSSFRRTGVSEAVFSKELVRGEAVPLPASLSGLSLLSSGVMDDNIRPCLEELATTSLPPLTG
jgi:hypothetical protein